MNNQPLPAELGFQLGETLQYRITAQGKALGLINFGARERKQFQGNDSVLLTAAIVGVEPGVTIIHPGDSMSAQVDPETLAPVWFESRFPGGGTSEAGTGIGVPALVD